MIKSLLYGISYLYLGQTRNAYLEMHISNLIGRHLVEENKKLFADILYINKINCNFITWSSCLFCLCVCFFRIWTTEIASQPIIVRHLTGNDACHIIRIIITSGLRKAAKKTNLPNDVNRRDRHV